jgi:hypothetical protein
MALVETLWCVELPPSEVPPGKVPPSEVLHSGLTKVMVCRLRTSLYVECCVGLAPSELQPGQRRLLCKLVMVVRALAIVVVCMLCVV